MTIYKYIKQFLATIILIFSANAFATDPIGVGVVDPQFCGINVDGVIIAGDTTICPQDGAIKGLYELFPTLTLEVLASINLDYSDQILDELRAKPISLEQRRGEVIAYYVKKLLYPLTLIVLAWSLFQLTFAYATDNFEGNKTGGMNVYQTLLFALFAGTMYLPIGDFHLYQYLTVAAAIAGIGLSNFFISFISFLYQAETQPDLISEQPEEYYQTTADALLIAEKEIELGLCITQLVNRDMLRLNQNFWARTPIIDSFGYSKNGDAFSTPIEVLHGDTQTIMNYGSGVQKRGLKDGFTDWATGRDPQLCGNETIVNSEDYIDVAMEIDTDFSNSKEVLVDQIIKEMGSDEIETKEELDQVGAISQKIHSALMNIIRDPETNEEYRMESLTSSILIAENIRRLNCLVDDPMENIIEAKTSIKNLSDVSYNTNLRCITNISSYGFGGAIEITDPKLMYTNEILEDSEGMSLVDRETARLREEINAGVEDLVWLHQESIAPVINSYLNSRFIKNNNSLSDILIKARQGGIATFAANFMNMSLYADEYLKTSAPYQVLLPQVSLEQLDERMLPNVDRATAGVGIISTLGYEFKTPRSRVYSEADLVVDIERLASARKRDEQNVKDSANSIYENFFLSISERMGTLTTSVGLGYDSKMFDKSDLKEMALRERWGSSRLSTTYVLQCFRGDMTGFNRGMIEQCGLLQQHPSKILSNLGVSMFNTGAWMMQYMLIAKGSFSKKISGDGSHGSAGKSNSNGVEIAKDKSQQTLNMLQRVGSFILGGETFIYTISLILMFVGAVLGWLIPLIPALSAGALYIYWLLSVVIGVVGGPILLIYAFSPRMNQGGGNAADSAWYKLLFQVVLKLPLVVISLAIVYIMTDLAIKLAIVVVNMFWIDLVSNSMGAFTYCTFALLLVMSSIYLYLKIYLTMMTKVGELATTVLKYAELGAHGSYAATTQRMESAMNDYIGYKLAKEAANTARSVKFTPEQMARRLKRLTKTDNSGELIREKSVDANEDKKSD